MKDVTCYGLGFGWIQEKCYRLRQLVCVDRVKNALRCSEKKEHIADTLKHLFPMMFGMYPKYRVETVQNPGFSYLENRI